MINKDLKRILDIQSQPGKELGLAGKMAKLIKDVDKANRRYNASVEVFGGSHVVTNIFWRRWKELSGDIIVNAEETVSVIETKTPKVEQAPIVLNRITRKQSDFPISVPVKFNDNVGEVISYHEEELDKVFVLFEDRQELVDIYDLKRI
jgi:hypothetical protein